MAKLNGVVLTAEAIAYNGVKYEKIDETPRAGDILRVDDSDYSYVTEDAFYEVYHVDSSDDPQIIDNDGHCFDGNDIEYTLFRKVTEPQTATTQQYREVNRKAEVGEKAKVVGGYSHLYKRGDIVVAIAEQSYVTNGVRFKREDGRIQTMVHTHGDYVVLEPIAEPSDDIIEVDGVKYRKVDRDPKVGDYIIAKLRKRDVTEGKIYEVMRIDFEGDPIFKDDVGDYNWAKDFQVVERIATSDDLQRQVSELQTQLAEAESKLATQRAEEEKAKLSEQEIAEMDRLKVGEYAKVIGGGNVNTEVGDIVIIRSVDSDGDYRINSLDGRGLSGYKLPHNLVRATDEEVAEARRKLELSKFSVGDYVKVLVDTEGLDEGAIGKVTRVDERVGEWLIKVELLNGSNYDWYKPEQLEKVSEEVAKWAVIGREVGELKDGDLVQFTASTGAWEYGVGSFATIQDVCGSSFRFGDSGCYGGEASWCKLTAPVESVVNLATGSGE